jgi:hypothetical protein
MHTHRRMTAPSPTDSTRRRMLGSAAAACASAAGLLAPLAAQAAGRQRPLTDFLSMQGTFCADDGAGGCYLFVPPAPNFLGWNTWPPVNDRVTFAGMDYAGLANAFLQNPFNTQVDGMVLEWPLPDGRAEVRVALLTSRANCWVIDVDLTGDFLGQVAAAPTLFGQRPGAGFGYALGRCSLDVRLINSAPGAPLPDLIQLNSAPAADQRLDYLFFGADVAGPLTAQFGVPEGTPGRCTIRQNGLLAVASKASPKSRVGADGFPVERVDLRRIGR